MMVLPLKSGKKQLGRGGQRARKPNDNKTIILCGTWWSVCVRGTLDTERNKIKILLRSEQGYVIIPTV